MDRFALRRTWWSLSSFWAERFMKILIADDDAVSRRLLQSYLQKWGFEVASAKDGAEAWDLFEGGGFPIVISDWMMPELDGPGLIRRIRSCQRPGYIYAILLTAKSQKEDLVEGMEAGADDFLTKPFDRDELRVRLRAGERIIRLEQNLRETKVALIQSEKLAGLGRLAAGVAHEINNPLAFVVNNLALLRRDVLGALRVLDKYREGGDILARAAPGLAVEATRLEEEADLPYFRENLPRLFESSEEGLRRVRAIVQNLRDFARLDEAEFQEVDLNSALRSTLEVLRYELDKKAIRVATSFEDLPPVACYAGKVDQALLNIVLNAIQASERETLIEIRTRPDGEAAVVVEVEDHGGGIPPEHLPHIFEPFFTTKPVGAGTGLGLSVSYGVVRDQGGTIEVESVVGRGSLFRIRIPLRPRTADAGTEPPPSR
jgi:two-component system NtrC family sensor kinase